MVSKAKKVDSLRALDQPVGKLKCFVAESSFDVSDFMDDLYALRNREQFVHVVDKTVRRGRKVAKNPMHVNNWNLSQRQRRIPLAKRKLRAESHVEVRFTSTIIVKRDDAQIFRFAQIRAIGKHRIEEMPVPTGILRWKEVSD